MLLKRQIKKIIITVIPLEVWQKIYYSTKKARYKSYIADKICLNKSTLEKYVQQAKRSKKIIRITEFAEPYNSFNMCFFGEMVDAAVLCVGLGGMPRFEVMNIKSDVIENSNIFETIYNNYQGEGELCQVDISSGYNIVLNPQKLGIYGYIYNNIFNINKQTLSYIEKTKKQIGWTDNGKVLGVSYRGTDFNTLRPKGHPIQPSIEELISKTSEFIAKYGYQYIYITADEKKVIEIFREKFPQKVLAMEREYYDKFYFLEDVKWVTQVQFDRENDTYLKGVEYFCSVYLLSKCDALVGGIHGATRAAMIMNEQHYAHVYLFNKGYYE